MSGNDEHELMMVLHRDEDTEAAFLVSETGDSKKIWLPRSKASYEHTGKFWQERVGSPSLSVVTVKLPQWLAERNGLV